MIKLKNILLEVLSEGKENHAPYGVMFFGNDKVLVGDDHRTPIELSKDLIKRIVDIGQKHGYYGEGSGIQANPAVNKSAILKYLNQYKSPNKGSWDDLVKPENKSDFLYALFANVAENHRLEKLMSAVKEGETILDLITRERNNYAATKGTSPSDVKKFLTDASDGEYDFLKMANEPATKESLQTFLSAGESKMWPENWKDYPNAAGQVARRATSLRDEWLKSAPNGVYFVGNGHLEDIAKMGAKPSQYIPPSK